MYRSALEDVRWTVESSRYECQLRQPLGVWGSAGFVREAGAPAAFVLSLPQVTLPERLRVTVLDPEWSGKSEMTVLGEIHLDRQRQAGETVVTRMLSALDQGQRLIIAEADNARHDPLRVVIEPLHFQSGWLKFQQCTGVLVPRQLSPLSNTLAQSPFSSLSPSQLSRMTILFAEGDAPLPPGEIEKLDALVHFVRAGNRLSGIYIDGHADNFGGARANQKLSRLRAQRVAGYLAEQGVDKRLLMVRWHGDRYPIVSNVTDEGRARNRRVTIRLEP